jgi:hypothetical protein
MHKPTKRKSPAEWAEEYAEVQRRLKREAAERRQTATARPKGSQFGRVPHGRSRRAR